MKYYTESLFAPEIPIDIFIARTESALQAYSEYVASVRTALPPGVQKYLSYAGFHDELVYKISHYHLHNTVDVLFSDLPDLCFTGVYYFHYEGGVIDPNFPCSWLYDEVELLGAQDVEFRVLLACGELTVRCKDVRRKNHLNDGAVTRLSAPDDER